MSTTVHHCGQNLQSVILEKGSPVKLSLQLLHVVVTLSVVRGLSFCKVLQTSQVVELRRSEEESEGEAREGGKKGREKDLNTNREKKRCY